MFCYKYVNLLPAGFSPRALHTLKPLCYDEKDAIADNPRNEHHKLGVRWENTQLGEKKLTNHKNNLPEIPGSVSLKEWQSYTKDLVQARGWDKASDLEVFLLLSEEVGELAKAFRRHRELFIQSNKSRPGSTETKNELASEMADVLSYLLDLAQRMDIDLEEALINKEEYNRKRSWD